MVTLHEGWFLFNTPRVNIVIKNKGDYFSLTFVLDTAGCYAAASLCQHLHFKIIIINYKKSLGLPALWVGSVLLGRRLQ